MRKNQKEEGEATLEIALAELPVFGGNAADSKDHALVPVLFAGKPQQVQQVQLATTPAEAAEQGSRATADWGTRNKDPVSATGSASRGEIIAGRWLFRNDA